VLAICMLLLSFCLAQAQITEETYHRAEYFLSNNIQKEVYHMDVNPNWSRDENTFWHQTYIKDGKRFFITTIDQAKTEVAFDHEQLAKQLGEKSGKNVEAANLPFSRIQLQGKDGISFEFQNQTWIYKDGKLAAEKKTFDKKNNSISISPDGNWKAYVKNFNLYVENLQSGTETQLSFDGKKNYEYASYWGWSDKIHEEDGTRPEHLTINWSPDSKKIQTQIVDLRLAEKMLLLDNSQNDKFRPQLLGYYRASPGDTTVVNYTPVIFDL